MKQHSRFRLIATTLCSIVTILFFFFYLYMYFHENVSIYSPRHAHEYTTLSKYSVEKIENTDSPSGISTTYHFLLEDIKSDENCLCFYLVHHYAQVYIDGELIYQLDAHENNRIGKTISSNWVTIPIHQEDDSKELQIILTPLFENMANFEPEFLFGSHFAIIIDQVKEDIPQLFLALLCILLGLFIIATQFYFRIHTSDHSWDMFYLGGFAVALGLWRITDAKSSPIMFSQNPMLLGYITIGSLFVCGILLQLYISTFFRKKQAIPVLVIATLSSVITLLVLLLQVSGIAEFKQMLHLSHLLLLIALGSVLVITIFSKDDKQSKQSSRHRRLFLILAVGIVMDIIWFYVHGSSSHVMYSVVAFVAYTLVVFMTSILDTTKKAQLDSPTGLINKSRWHELMNSIQLDEEMIGITMIDLNGLKHVNDTFGHEVGDKMIYDFATLLKKAFPPSCVICRWGGDEFVIMTTDKDSAKLSQYSETLKTSVDAHNSIKGNLQLSYAIGSCLSTEHPGLDHTELLAIADNKMYEDKKKKVV